MPGLFENKSLPHADLLASVPHRNRAVTVAAGEVGKTLLTGPVAAGRIKKLFGTTASQKKFELDELGLDVWQSCDGRSTVEMIVRDFARRRRVNVREAEVAVATFLKTLVARNLVALAITPAETGPKKAARRQKERSHARRS